MTTTDNLLIALIAALMICVAIVLAEVIAQPRRLLSEALWAAVAVSATSIRLLDRFYARVLPGLKAPQWMAALNFRCYRLYWRSLPVQGDFGLLPGHEVRNRAA